MSIFGVDCLLLYLLLARTLRGPSALPLLGVTLALSSAYLFAFSRLAILEPLLAGLLLLAFLLASQSSNRRPLLAVAIGGVCLLLLLTKTTGLFLLPGVFYLLGRNGFRLSLKAPFIAATVLCGGYAGYYAMVVHAGFADDFADFFTGNVYPHPATMMGWFDEARTTLLGIFWTGRIVPLMALLLSIAGWKTLRRQPIFAGAWISMASYLGFILLHSNSQPRYYLPIAFLLILTGVLAIAQLAPRSFLRIAAAGMLAIACGLGVIRVSGYLRHPEYTLVDAASGLTRYIDQHPSGNRILLSSSGNQISLMTGLPAINDEEGLWDLPERMALYQPGWYAAWNDVDPDILADIHKHAWLERVAVFAATDDPDRNQLILYRLNSIQDSSKLHEDQGVVVDE